MEFVDLDLRDGTAVIEHRLGTEELAVWVKRPDGELVQPFLAVPLDAQRVEVCFVPGVPVAAVVVEANHGD
ncbi:hypothetical protein [Microbispora sp. NPDC049125]|uniref:hypothetical protein n=1 Tax=Microbispora sp. NPDC049125 TaxID=3154929 RepID=UPI0034663813